jgi:hypothetical protein
LIGVLTCGLMAEVCRLLPDLAGDLSASRAYLEMIANRLQK